MRWLGNHTFRRLAVVRSWSAEFIGNNALGTLEGHISELIVNPQPLGRIVSPTPTLSKRRDFTKGLFLL